MLTNFIYMHGYGWYVWTSYLSVITIFFIQWYLPWRRYRRALK